MLLLKNLFKNKKPPLDQSSLCSVKLIYFRAKIFLLVVSYNNDLLCSKCSSQIPVSCYSLLASFLKLIMFSFILVVQEY